MFKWLFRFLCLAGGLLAGFVAAYALVSFKVAATSPFGLNLSKHTEPSDRVFVGVVRLGEAEAVFRGCGASAATTNLNPSSREIFLQSETALIKQLRADSSSFGLTPPLDLAEAILYLRRGESAVQSAANGKSSSLRELLTRSGWSANSETALREAVSKMDQSCK